MHQLRDDLRYALRVQFKTPIVSAIILLSLAIGIGANSAVFSVADALLLRPLPYPEPNRLVAIWLHSPGIGILRDWPSPGEYIDIRNENRSFKDISISRHGGWILSGHGQPLPINGMRTSSNLFRLLGARPLIGRMLLPEDDVPGKQPVAVLSYGLWSRVFGSDPGVVGRDVMVDAKPIRVAGVLRPEFRLNAEVMPAEDPVDKLEMFMPFPLGADAVQKRGDENYNLLARLRPGVSVNQAQQDVNIIAARIREKDKRHATFGMDVVSLPDQVVGDVRRVLLVVLGSVLLVLLSACANVANILLARAAGREKEVAVRAALGAGWKQLARQFLTESILLSVSGAVFGLTLAWGGLQLMRAMNPGNIPRLEEISINGSVLLFTFAVSLVIGILFGLAPVLRATRVDLNTSLKTGGRTGGSNPGLRLSRHSLRGALVAAELALSLMLLVGAGLLTRSFWRVVNVPPGFATDGVLSMQLVASQSKYGTDKALGQFYSEIRTTLEHVPGIAATGFTSALPLTGTVGWGQLDIEGFTPAPGQELQVDIRTASANYFSAMQIPLRSGRYFSTRDNADAQRVALIDNRFAKRFWPHGSAVGKHVSFVRDKPMAIVGVVGSVKQYGLDKDAKIVVYLPDMQFADNHAFLAVRTWGRDPASLADEVVRSVHKVDSTVAIYDVQTMQERLQASLARQRFSMTLLGSFALFGVVLAAVGVYAVMAYLVEQSTHDIGVRMALGAQRGTVLKVVLRQGMGLAILGIAAGLAGAAMGTRFMSGLLFGIGATDLATFLGVTVFLALVAVLATYVPAWRATRVDPIVALRRD